MTTAAALLVAALAGGGGAEADATADAPAGGTQLVRTREGGLCISGEATGSVSGEVMAAECDWDDWQYWTEVPQAPTGVPLAAETYELVNAGSGLCLDSNGNGVVVMLPCLPGTPSQTWRRFGSTLLAEEGGFPVVSYFNAASGRCLLQRDGGVSTSSDGCGTGSAQFRRAW